METWFLNHVLGLSLSVLLLGLPGPLGAGTPGYNNSDPVTAGFYHSSPTDGLSNMENKETSSSYSSESLSAPQRDLLLSHGAEIHTATVGHLDTEQTQTFTETSSRSPETTDLSTKPFNSTLGAFISQVSSSSSGGGSGTSSSSSISSSSSRSSSTGSSSSNSRINSSSSSSRSSSTSSSSSNSRINSSSSNSRINSSSSTSTSSSNSRINSSTSSSSSSTSSTSSSSSSSSSTSSSSSSSTSSSSSSSSTSRISSSQSSSSSKNWKDVVNTDQVPDVSTTVFWETRSSTSKEVRLSQDSPDSTLWQGDATASQTAVHIDNTYTSTTFSRAGERNLLSVTSSSNNSTSSAFTEDSHSTWAVSDKATETEDYTHSAPSTRTDSGDTTVQHVTHSIRGMFPQTGDPRASRGTQNLTGSPNATQHQQTTMSEETSDSTPSLRVTELSSDQSETLVSSTPPVTLSAGGPANMSGTDLESGSNVGTSTEFSTAGHSSSTLNQEGTEQLSSQTREETVGLGLTTVSSTVSINTSEMDNSLTNLPVQVTDAFLTTTSVPITERSQITEEDTFKATVFTTTAPPLTTTSSSAFSSTTSSSTSESHTEASTPYTAPSTTASTSVPQISPVHPTHHMSPNQTRGPSTGIVNPTDMTTLQKETSTGTLGVTTSHNQYVTTTYTHSPPTRSTEFLHTTGKQTDRETTVLVVTTPPSDIQPTKAPPPPRNPCVSNPCKNGGMCLSSKRQLESEFTCQCQQGWTGSACEQDMDDCESKPCPLGSRCVNTRGSFSCECPLGFDLEDGRTCTRAKTFLGTFSVNRPHDPAIFRSAMHEIQREILQLLNASLSALQGYSRSTLREVDGVGISAVNMFSISADVTSPEVYRSIQMSLSNCSPSLAHCRMVLNYKLTYHVESLCVAQKTQCNPERSNCTDISGTAYCQCLPGYYKHHPDESACLECGDGYKLENGTCVPCMFGFGGFNCGNFYKLIAVVVSPAGGALLLALIIALIVTCCKKDKNDINKIIFKSGDLQMSPYADFPKNNRISMEWGRETIEMQENGSTKNLLQMNDIYYSPALRNADLERNGLYPFTGLPGSRHSCIYPAQWNPSFISDDSRRRDYF